MTVRRALRFTALTLGALAVLGAGFVRCAAPSNKSIAQAFAGRTPPAFRTLDVLDRKIFVAELGPADATPVLLIHGSPGSWRDSLEILRDPGLAERAHLIAVDRPGFGGSDHGRLETSLERQSALLAAVLTAAAPPGHAPQPAIVVGHSLGGPVAARLAMDRPDLVRGLVLVAASIDPAQEKVTWYQAAARWPIVRSLVPDDLALANDEILPLKGELEKMLPLWSTIHVPVVVIQGDADGLVPKENADFAARMLTGAQVHMVRVPKQGHLIPWERPELMRDAIVELLPRTAAAASSPAPTPAASDGHR
jgi:pimeloyl-ACP methyl ester carboxylesterase